MEKTFENICHKAFFFLSVNRFPTKNSLISKNDKTDTFMTSRNPISIATLFQASKIDQIPESK